MEVDKTITIPNYYKGKNIFITGGSGFIGKVLIEMILRFCPDVSKIYFLIRPKKGKSVEERINQILGLALFDKLKQEYPDNLKKLVPILGDVKELELGLSPESRQLLIDEVDIIFHAAASVRFDDELKYAILLNTRGTREVVNLGLEMKHLDVFVHVSTTYCQTDKRIIEEKIYPAHADWREAIELAENCDSYTLNTLTAKYISPLPNTYTFTKSLSERVINDLCDGRIPAVIIRPSIVISTLKEPFPGWIDNFNGPVGILIACGKGILRTVYTRSDIVADYMTVDILSKLLIICTWIKKNQKPEEKVKLEVYNASNNKINNVSIKEMIDIAKDLSWKYPLNDILWIPSRHTTSCKYYYYLIVIFYHFLPALVVDGLLKLFGKKPMLLKIQRIIYVANSALGYFLTQEWEFKNDKGSQVENHILPEDLPLFSYYRNEKTPFDFFQEALKGARTYLLKENISTLPKAKSHMKRMYVLTIVVNALWYLTLFYLFVFKYNIPGILINKIYQYICAL